VVKKMKRAATPLLTLLALLSAAPGATPLAGHQGESCRPDHVRVNRCEGVTSVPTGNPTLEVLSFTAGDKEAFAGRDVELKVRFFQNAPGRLSITARELNPKRLYFMRANQTEWGPAGAWHEFRPWPTGDVINRHQVSEKNLGVLVRGSGNHLLPALVYHSTPPASVKMYKMSLRTRENFNQVELSLYGTLLSNKPGDKTWERPRPKVNFAFEVEIDASEFKEGPMRLVVKLVKRKADLSVDEANSHTETYTFYHRRATS
jgi:hypothetical protein